MLGAISWYGTHAGDASLKTEAVEYANELADAVEEHLTSDGRVQNGARNQAATQGAISQGLLWASQLDGVQREPLAETVLAYLLDDLWNEDAGTFASGVDDDTYRLTARDAGDITGGLNAADAVRSMAEVREPFAAFFNNAFNRGRFQRAERPESRDPSSPYPLPLSSEAGGEYGQAAVYNTAVEYDTATDEWRVVDDIFTTEQAMYLANQHIWIGMWGGSHYPGRGIPGQSDTPPTEE